jgi:glutathione synthase
VLRGTPARRGRLDREPFHQLAVKATIDARDREIIATVGPFLREHGQVFVGLDVIGGMLTELNITSPTGVRHASPLDGTNVAGAIIDCIERLARARRR